MKLNMFSSDKIDGSQSVGLSFLALAATFGVGVVVGSNVWRWANSLYSADDSRRRSERDNNDDVVACQRKGITRTDDERKGMNHDGCDNSAIDTINTPPSNNGESSSKSIVLVVQRFRYGRFLLHHCTSATIKKDEQNSNSETGKASLSQKRIVHIGSQHCDIDSTTFQLVQDDTTKLDGSIIKSGGMIVYISFSKHATLEKVAQAAKTILNLPVMTKGVWGDGTKTKSLLQLSSELYQSNEKLEKKEQLSIERGAGVEGDNAAPTLVIIPQANLISKAKNNGKSLQYHDQIEKSKGEEFYHLFVDMITQLALEYYQDNILPRHSNNNKKQNGSRNTKKQSPSSSSNPSIDKSIPPQQMFRLPPHISNYSEWDTDTGLPTKDKEGNPLTKSAIKRTRKLYDAQAKRYAKYVEQEQPDGTESKGVAAPVEEASTPNLAESNVATAEQGCCSSLDPRFLKIVAGSFGKRQALEFTADMGPFCQVIDIT